MQAYIYIRFSTPKQEKGASKERQREDCEAFCARRNWPVAEVIEDLGRSAWTGAHLSAGNLGKFTQRFREGDIPPDSVLVVEKLDRLSRQEPRVTQRWMEDLCAAGLSIATVSGDRVYDDAGLKADLMGTLEILIRAKLANDESAQKSERVLDRIGRNMQRAKETGRVITAKAPGWLIAKEDRTGFDVVEDQVAVVTRIYEMAADGKGARWITRELNELGFPAWGNWRGRNSTATWEPTYVAQLLRHPAVEGDFVPGFSNSGSSRSGFNERIVGYYPRIVDADLVARARASIDARKTQGGRYTRNVANLFAGFVFCHACGNKMHLRSNGQKNPQRHWQCTHAARSRGCSQRAMFRYQPFETAALDAVLHLALDDRFFSSPDRTGELAKKVADLDKAISDHQEQSARLVKVLARVDDAPEVEEALMTLRRQTRELEAEKGKAADDLQAARGSVSPAEHLSRVRDVRGALDDPNPDVRRSARLRVQSALKELGCRVECEVDENGERQIGLMLRGGALSCVFDNHGKLLLQFDLIDLLEQLEGIVDLDSPAGLEDAVARFGQLVPGAPGTLDAAWLAKLVRRMRDSRALNDI